jgi:hypothetical protein
MTLRPEPFGSELKVELLRPRGSSTCLKAELLRPKGAAEGKGKASPLEEGDKRHPQKVRSADRQKYPLGGRPISLSLDMRMWPKG